MLFIVKRKFLKLINEYKPDIIVNVHPMFSGSLLNILKKKKYKYKIFHHNNRFNYNKQIMV
nr:hypothetical protein [Brachyspira hampsonii]